jgi:hypothetical protein
MLDWLLNVYFECTKHRGMNYNQEGYKMQLPDTGICDL